MYTYAWYEWLSFFYIYSFFGWIFESTYVSLRKHRFINRGFLRLPLIPLYGTGALTMLWATLPVTDYPLLAYLAGCLAPTVLEYFTGFFMEQLFRVRYWDYSSQKFNLHGYICLSSSLVWGILTLSMIYGFHRPVARLVAALWLPALLPCLLAVSAAFVWDTVHSVREALKLKDALEAITRIRAEMDEAQVQLALLKAELMERAPEVQLRDAFLTRLDEIEQRRPALEEPVAALRERIYETDARMNQIRERMEAQLAAPHSILRRNPTASSRRFEKALSQIREARTQLRREDRQRRQV